MFDLRQKRLEGRVTNQEDELLSVQIVKVRPKRALNPLGRQTALPFIPGGLCHDWKCWQVLLVAVEEA